MSNLGTAKHSIVLSSPKLYNAEQNRLVEYLMNLSSQGIEILVLTYTANEQTEYLQKNLQRLPPTTERSHARALRIFFPKKTVNPALIRITACNQAGCECMVCTSNPSLMTGLSYPDIGSYTRTFS